MDISTARAQEAQNVFSSTTTTTEAREKEKCDSEHRARYTVDSIVENQSSATRQAQALQDEMIDVLVTVTRK